MIPTLLESGILAFFCFQTLQVLVTETLNFRF